MYGSPTIDTSDYRSELMGIYAAMANTLAVTTLRQIQDGELPLDCDNEKALYVSSLQGLKGPTSTKHADILRCIRQVYHQFPLKLNFTHIKAHQDDTIL